MEFPKKNFLCTLCGECCSGDMKVFLNPQDLDKMRNAMGMECNQQLLDEGVIMLDKGQRDLLLPRLEFKEVTGLQFCPFLENRVEDDGSLHGLCRLHPYGKPLVCALAPFARELDLVEGSSRFYFQEPVKDCPGCHSREVYRMEELFPQVEEELVKEGKIFQEIEKKLNEGSSNEEILWIFFKLDSSANPGTK